MKQGVMPGNVPQVPHLARHCPGQDHAQGRMPVDVLQERLLVLGRDVFGNLQRHQLCMRLQGKFDRLNQSPLCSCAACQQTVVLRQGNKRLGL